MLGHHKRHRTARCHAAATKSDPIHLHQLIDGAATDRHAANLLDFGPCHRLMIRHNRQSLDRRPRQFAGLGHLFVHEVPQIARRAQRPRLAHPHQIDAAPLVPETQSDQGLGRIAADRQARDQFGHGHRFGRGKQDRLDHAFLRTHRRRLEQTGFNRPGLIGNAHAKSRRRISMGAKVSP